MRKLNELLKQIQELPNYDCKESWELFRTLDISVDKELVNREDLPTMVFIAILARGGNGFEHNYIRGSEKIIVSIVPCLDCGIKGSVKYKYQSEIDDIPDGK